MNKKRKAYIESCEVSYVKTAILGGYSQKYAVEGKKKDSPIVLCLHGGPGFPIPFSVGCRGLFPEFTDQFIMVYWDQLGCGINRYEINNDFTIEHFAQMTIDLIRVLKQDFPKNKLYLFGMSWGSILALHAAMRISKFIDGVVTCGQVLSVPMFSEDTFEAIEKSSAPEKQKKFVRELHLQKDNFYQNGMRLSKIIRKYTDGYYNHNAKPTPMGNIMKGMMKSPDYRFKDFIAVFKNGYAKNESLMMEMAKVDLKDVLKNISIPYKIFQGDTDIVTSTKAIMKFVDTCDNPNVSYRIISNMGHFPTFIAMQEILKDLTQMAFKKE